MRSWVLGQEDGPGVRGILQGPPRLLQRGDIPESSLSSRDAVSAESAEEKITILDVFYAARAGEKYRNELMKLVSGLGLEEHVRFDNRFLSKHELIRYLQATDIYLTPYISPNQISSGALTYAIGAGKATVSTPYFHAQEMLANDSNWPSRR